MLALTSPYLWYTIRATGVVALVLLTLSMVLGALVATRVGGRAVGRFELNEIHRSLSLMTVLFVAIHVFVTVIDSYVPIGLTSVVLPLTSSYRRWPVALGTVALDLMLAVALTSVAKQRLRHSTWRVVHWFSGLSFVTAVVHEFLTGSDAHRPWSLVLIASCVGAVAAAGLWRVTQRPTRAGGRTAFSPPKGLISHAHLGITPRETHAGARGPAPATSRRVGSDERPLSPPPAPPRRRPQ